jgi:hypothetical protein
MEQKRQQQTQQMENWSVTTRDYLESNAIDMMEILFLSNIGRPAYGPYAFFLNECLVDQQLGRSRGQLRCSPLANLLLQRTKVPLRAINTDGRLLAQNHHVGIRCRP